MTQYLFYPGCAMESSARAYAASLASVAKTLDLDLAEVKDWNCCGATEYLGINLIPAYALIGRNLALAAQQAKQQNGAGAHTLVASCSACYLNLAKADHYMAERPVLGDRVNEALAAGGLGYKPGTLKIRHLLDVLINDIGLDKVREKVTRPLHGLRVAPYLGCMVPRPDYDKRWSDYEQPDELDRLLRALGAEVIDFPLKSECCGGHMPQISPNTAFELIRRLLQGADQYKADLIVTVCPMCQMNLDAYQDETNRHFHTHYRLPTVFFTQVMGLAFGADPEALGFGSEIVDARPALGRIQTTPVASGPVGARPRAKAEGLPMPGRRPEERER
ncbi:MAG: CoB--CoM heterodisulfide reductase iron-sulfur subunit B family protein [Anaerolineales bacterium]|nr:CoB--CoM heterodisulfide reductase iron-sulfur subunit B family protein [Anaerolineales bacterium]